MFKKELKKKKAILIITVLIFSTYYGIYLPNSSQKSNITIDINAWAPPAEVSDNYGAALQKAIYFYILQRSGKLPTDNPCIWRGDSCLNDGSDVGLDLTGGYFDAGDHVKFGLPIASTIVTLALTVYEYESVFRSLGQYEEVIDAIKWGTDYFIKCNPDSNTFYFQVGDGGTDHAWWGPAEVLENVMSRPSYKVTATQGGSAVCGATASALTLTSIILEDSDPSYAALCLDHAIDLYNLARIAQSDDYYNSIAGSFYESWSGFWDEIAATGAMLYLKTGDNKYLTQAEEAAQNWNTQGQEPYWEYKWGHSWDDMHYIAQMLLADITGKQEYIDSVERNLDWWMPEGGITYTTGGLAWLNSWGSLRYASNTAFMAFMWVDNPLCTSSKVSIYRNFAENQINYILGENPNGRSYICGFGTNPPVNPHHRTAHGSWANSVNTPEETRHILYGALVGGPNASDYYQDDRTDFEMNEVACDYNSGLIGALAKMVILYGGSPHSDFPRISWFKPIVERIPEIYLEARLNSEGNTYTEISVDLINHAAWPARNGDKLLYRYFFDISECIDAGYSINDIIITKGYTEAPVTVSGPHQLMDNEYYIDIDHTGFNIFPGGQSECAIESQIRIGLPNDAPPSAWAPTNDYSYQGLSNIKTISKYIYVYNDGIQVWPNNINPGPIINHPDDITYYLRTTGNMLTWIATDDNPTTFTIYRDSTYLITASWWSGVEIKYPIDGLDVGTYTYRCIVSNADGYSTADSVIVSVIDPHPFGDVNRDGTVDIKDALWIARYYVGLNPQPFYEEQADINSDGFIDIKDALLIARYYVGLIPSLPPP